MLLHIEKILHFNGKKQVISKLLKQIINRFICRKKDGCYPMVRVEVYYLKWVWLIIKTYDLNVLLLKKNSDKNAI